MANRNATTADLPPEFDAVDSALLQSALRQGELRVSVHVWGDAASDGQALLAAHILKSSGLGSSTAPGGPVRSRQVGDVFESYAVASPTSVLGSDLGSTNYGRQYLALQATIVTAGAWVASSAWRSW